MPVAFSLTLRSSLNLTLNCPVCTSGYAKSFTIKSVKMWNSVYLFKALFKAHFLVVLIFIPFCYHNFILDIFNLCKFIVIFIKSLCYFLLYIYVTLNFILLPGRDCFLALKSPVVRFICGHLFCLLFLCPINSFNLYCIFSAKFGRYHNF